MNVIKPKVADWINKAAHDLGSAKLIYLHLTKDELENAINISQEFRDFVIKLIGVKE